MAHCMRRLAAFSTRPGAVLRRTFSSRVAAPSPPAARVWSRAAGTVLATLVCWQVAQSQRRNVFAESVQEKHNQQQQSHKYGDQVDVLASQAVRALFSVIRDKNCDRRQFQIHADRILRLVAEEALARLPITLEQAVETPCGVYQGLVYPKFEDVCAVSIMRSGDILLNALQNVAPGISVGKLLCQRDESHPQKIATISYSKLPADIQSKFVILVDPMLATGGSCALAIDAIKAAGVPENRIAFINLVSCPEGLEVITSRYPQVKIITAEVDQGLNEHRFIVPGLGDFGDRYWGTGH